jgi:hypothetical protein
MWPFALYNITFKWPPQPKTSNPKPSNQNQVVSSFTIELYCQGPIHICTADQQ